jgi:transcriptional regulator with PAS, ATPase and Fis domain
LASHRPYDEHLMGRSPAMCEIRETIEKVAGTDSTILITGETGSGKGLVARLIHDKSKRRDGKFVAFSCGAVPETLFESELFGHKKGAFTNAIKDKIGLFEDADHGTLFLDDISNTPLAVQPKLLQAIEWKTIRRLGEVAERRVDVRLVSATNQDLKKMMKKELFRADLFYRISVLTIHVPPLRERKVDIPILGDYFLQKYVMRAKRHVLGFNSQAMEKMMSYHWPGIVRELQNVIEGAVSLAHGKHISVDDLGFTGNTRTRQPLYDQETIKNALKLTKGNVSNAAKQLGVTRRTLYRYMGQYEIKLIR